MATNPIIPNCVEIKLRWTAQSILFMNVLHAQYTLAGPLNPSVGETVFAAFKASAAMTSWLALIPSSTALQSLSIKDLRSANAAELLSTGAPAIGTGAATDLPRQVAQVVTLRTAQAGRAFRGRVYLGGLGLDQATATGDITTASNAAGVALVNALSTVLSAQSMLLAIGQHELPPRTNKKGETLPLRPANVVPVTTVLARDTRFDTQRRRLQ